MTTASINVLAYLRERLERERQLLDHLVAVRNSSGDTNREHHELSMNIEHAMAAMSALTTQIEVLERAMSAEE